MIAPPTPQILEASFLCGISPSNVARAPSTHNIYIYELKTKNKREKKLIGKEATPFGTPFSLVDHALSP